MKTNRKNIKKLKRELLKKFLSINKIIKNYWTKNSKVILYIIMLIFGVIFLISASFVECDIVQNILIGIGTGIITSIIVTFFINSENDRREKRKKEEDKYFIFNDLLENSIDIYGIILYKINEFTTLSEIDIKTISKLYNNIDLFDEFYNYIKKINYEKELNASKDNLNRLFNFDEYQLDGLVLELKNLSRKQYYLFGILTQDEYNNLISDLDIDTYYANIRNIKQVYDSEIKDYLKCVEILKETICICSNIIGNFKFAKNKVMEIENIIKEKIEKLYFDEVYSKSELYKEELKRRAEEEEEFLSSHPEVYDEMIKYENETEEERLLRRVEMYINSCIFRYDITNVLKKLDCKNNIVKEFFKRKDIKNKLKKDRKKRKVIERQYGKNYLKIIEREDNLKE